MSNAAVRFDSSLARSAQVTTALVVGILLLGTLPLFFLAGTHSPALAWVGVAFGLIVLLALYLFFQAPQGIQLEGQELTVVRRIGAQAFSLAHLRASRAIGPSEMQGLVRTSGVGGFLGWWGSFRSSALGSFRLYATRLDRLVLLEFDDTKVVVSVNDPSALVDGLGLILGKGRA